MVKVVQLDKIPEFHFFQNLQNQVKIHGWPNVAKIKKYSKMVHLVEMDTFLKYAIFIKIDKILKIYMWSKMAQM